MPLTILTTGTQVGVTPPWEFVRLQQPQPRPCSLLQPPALPPQQLPLQQAEPASHSCPQDPQFSESEPVSTQPLGQQVHPAAQGPYNKPQSLGIEVTGKF